MGWNTGYAIFEETVIGAYNLGVLDKKLLKVLMEPYRGTDIDSGGSNNLESKDGLSVEEVVIKLMDPVKFKALAVLKKPIAKHPKNHSKLTDKQSEEQEMFFDTQYKMFHGLTKKNFGWG